MKKNLTPPKQNKRSTFKPIFILCSILFIEAICFGIILPVLGPLFFYSETILPQNLPTIAKNLLYNITLTLPMLFMVIGAPLFGGISDHLGRKKTLIIGLFGGTCSFLLSGFGVLSCHITLLIAGRALFGLFCGTEAIARSALIDISKNQNMKIKNMGFITLSSSLGFIIGPLLGGLLSSITSSSTINNVIPFFISALLNALNLFGVLFFFKEKITTKVKGENKAKFKIDFHAIGHFHFLKNKTLLYFILFLFCIQLIWASYFHALSLLVISVYQFTNKQLGFLMMFLAFLFSIASTFIVSLLLRIGSKQKVMLSTLMLILFGVLFILLFHNPSAIWLSATFITIGIGVHYNLILALLSDAAPPSQQGKVMGLSSSVVSLSWVVSSLIIGILAAMQIYSPYVFLLLIGLFLIRQIVQLPKKMYQ